MLLAAGFLASNRVYLDAWNDLIFLAGFLVFAIRGGVLIGHVKVRGHQEWFFPGLTAAYGAAIFAAVRVAALNAPTLPLVEVNAESDVLPDCSELPKDRTFVKVSEAPNLLYLYNESGFFALSVVDAQPLRYHKDCLCYGPRVDRSEITADFARILRRLVS